MSLATSAGFGHSVGQTIIFGYLDRALWGETDFDIEVFGDRHPIKQVDGPLFDPQNANLKS